MYNVTAGKSLRANVLFIYILIILKYDERFFVLFEQLCQISSTLSMYGV